MKRPAWFWIPIIVAGLAGFGCAQVLLRVAIFHDELGKIFDRGPLLRLVDGSGIYQVDLDRQLAESADAAGIEEDESTDAERQVALTGLIANTAVQSRAWRERVSQSDWKSELSLLRFQFPDDKTWRAALNKSDLSPSSLARLVSGNLKTREWISRRIAAEVTVTDDECRRFYDSHRQQFFLPEKRDARHLFLAAPPETPPDVVARKQSAVGMLAAQLLASPKMFAVLTAHNSEDDATKLQGGRLGHFSAERMPPDFFEAVSKLRPGEIGGPIRTRLGFHIIELLDVQPARYQTFDEVRGDIAVELANKKRETAIEILMVDLGRDSGDLRRF